MIVEYTGSPVLFKTWFEVYTRKLFQTLKGQEMGTTADIQKLIDRMNRAKGLTERAANTGARGEAIMDRFEARLNGMDDHFSKIDEYEKQLAAMDQLGNGGPPLDDTFQAPQEPAPAATEPAHVAAINPATGDPLKRFA